MNAHDELSALLAYHVQSADTIRATLGLLPANGGNGRVPVPDGSVVSILDKKRPRRKTARKPTTTPPASGRSATAKASRRRSAKRLATFGTTPRPAKGKGLSALIARGYLLKQSDGYVRTDKPFEV